MNKILVIPDIHCEFELAEGIISAEKPDLTIFLGDYFDRYDTDPQITINVASWLKSSSEKPNRIHLLGNHELFYVSGNERLICSGNTGVKRSLINQAEINWNKFKLCYWMDDWLITHAGLTKDFYDSYKNPTDTVKEFIELHSKKALSNLIDGKNHKMFDASIMRGGHSEIAGMLWCDINEFKPIKGIKQIFGHTHIPRPWEKFANNWCIDSEGYYAVYENKKLEIRNANNLNISPA